MSRKAKKNGPLGQPKPGDCGDPSAHQRSVPGRTPGGARLADPKGFGPPSSARELNTHAAEQSGLDLYREDVDWRYSL